MEVKQFLMEEITEGIGEVELKIQDCEILVDNILKGLDYEGAFSRAMDSINEVMEMISGITAKLNPMVDALAKVYREDDKIYVRTEKDRIHVVGQRLDVLKEKVLEIAQKTA